MDSLQPLVVVAEQLVRPTAEYDAAGGADQRHFRRRLMATLTEVADAR